MSRAYMPDKVSAEGIGDIIDPSYNTAIFAVGRFQPPTLEDKKIINAIEKTIASLRGEADGYIFISDKVNEEHSKLKKKKLVQDIQSGMEFYKKDAEKELIRNPLSATFRTYLMKKMFYDTSVNIINSDICMENYGNKCNNYMPIVKILEENTYENIYIITPIEKVDLVKNQIMKHNIKRERLLKSKIEIIPITGYKSLEVKMRDAALRNDKRTIEKEMVEYIEPDYIEPNLLDDDIEYLITELVLGSGLEHDHANMDSVGSSSDEELSPRSPPSGDDEVDALITNMKSLKPDDNKTIKNIQNRLKLKAKQTLSRTQKNRRDYLAKKRGLRGGKKSRKIRGKTSHKIRKNKSHKVMLRNSKKKMTRRLKKHRIMKKK